jgi:predicted HicB family RNase H-like nuclease
MYNGSMAKQTPSPKRGRGRPKSDLTERMNIRYNPDQRKAWQNVADALGISLNAWINSTLNQAELEFSGRGARR